MKDQKVNVKLGVTVFIVFVITVYVFAQQVIKNQTIIEQQKIIPNDTKKTGPVQSAQENIDNNKQLQIYKNETYGYEFKYSPDSIITINSSDDNVILSSNPNGHWQNSIITTLNKEKLSLDQIFNQTVESLKTNKKDFTITDMFIGHRRAKKYSIKNNEDYGNTGIIIIDGDKIFKIFGDDTTNTNKINLDFIVQSFSLIPGPTLEELEKNGPFFIDSSGIYHIEEFNVLTKLEGADKETFKQVGNCSQGEMYFSQYSKDKNHIYINGNIAKDIDSSSFEYLGFLKNYDGMPWGVAVAKDSNYIYYGCGQAIKSIEKESFKLIDFGYAEDSRSIYYMNSILKIADRKTFKVLSIHKIGDYSGPFSKDKNYVYYQGQIIKNVSPKDCDMKGIEACLPSNWKESLDSPKKSLQPFTAK